MTNTSTAAIATNTGAPSLFQALGIGQNSSFGGGQIYPTTTPSTSLPSTTSIPFSATGTPTTSPTHAVTTTVKTTPVASPSTQSPTQTSGLGSYKGVAINPGSDSAILAQIALINASQLPVTGSADHTQTQSYAGDTTVPSQTNNFNVNPTGDTGTVPSSSLGTGSTYNDALNQRNQYEQKLLDAYNDPQIQQARQAAADANTNLLSAQKAQRDQNLAILSDGGMTRQQATPFATQADLINSNNVANYGLAANAAANQLGVYTQNQQNQIQGYGSLLSANQQDIQNRLAQVPGFQGTQVSPTGQIMAIIRDPVSGQVSSQSIGNLYDQTGTGGSTGGSTSSYSSGPITAANGSTISGSYAQAAQALPSSIQQYVQGGPQGVGYINLDAVPQQLQSTAQMYGAQAGIPVLTGAQSADVKSIDATYKALDGLDTLVQKTAGSGIIGTAKGLTLNPLQQFLGVGNGPLLNQFNEYRSSAISSVKALAGSTSGLRINGTELDAAVQNLPTAADNLQNAQSKLEKFRELLTTQLGEQFPKIPQGTQQKSNSTSGGSTGGWASLGD